ncbi:AAA family ATPase [Paraburkholderia sediminicola]|uniref:AAA family ATPase n=1 Tax=Paraburkholderia rhynchosiae TaxID=487049 RepID=A0ACC7NF88_9BURK
MSTVDKTRKQHPQDGVVLLNGAELKPQPVDWLWRGWLAAGKLQLLAGSPGLGKTTLAMAMAAPVTSGGRWPDGSTCERGHVLMWSGEDDPADTLKPRLVAAGGDDSRIFFVTGYRSRGELLPFDPSRHMAQLQAEAERIGDVRLIIVDPIVTAVSGDSHKNTEVRRGLQPLVDLAAALRAALIGITHLSKGGGDPVERVTGSIAFSAVPRIIMLAGKTESSDGDERRILARGKSNIGPEGDGFEYHIEQSEPFPGIESSCVVWGDALHGPVRDLLSGEFDAVEANEKVSRVATAEAFLRRVLCDGAVLSNDVMAEAASQGISAASVRRAQGNLGVDARKGKDTKWYWSLPRTTGPLNESDD